MYRLTTTHADGSQTVTIHDDHDEAIEAARRALVLGSTGAAIVRADVTQKRRRPRYVARVLMIVEGKPPEVVATAENDDWTRGDAAYWARQQAREMRAAGVEARFRPEVEVLR